MGRVIRPDTPEKIAVDRELLAAALTELRRLEWSASDSEFGERCPRCRNTFARGHAPNCTLTAVLARADTP